MAKRGPKASGLTRAQLKILRDFENSVYDLAFIGSAPLEQRESIKEFYESRKALLVKHLLKGNTQ